jgi:CubicO group peptidase (beta-lactamase class C family)
MRKILLILVGLVLAGLVVFLASPIHRIYLPTATGISAKQACSLHFVSGMTLERARELYIDPLLEPALPVLRMSVDPGRNQARASLLGLYRQTAVHRPGLGCTLVHDGAAFDRALAVPEQGAFSPLEPASAHRAAHFDEVAVETALDDAFAGAGGSGRNTLAIAVLHQGRLVAERYAEGIGPGTPLHGWSMAKSATTALAGALAERGDVALADPILPGQGDGPAVTLEHLLRMTSGLAMEERADGFDPNSDMLFTEADMAAWAGLRDRPHAPGAHWQYMSGNTVLAARALQDKLGDDLREQVRGLRSLLFDPIGVHSAVLEVDESGTFQGSSYLYAGAHDWARLAQLFLQDGVWQGRRVLAEGWVDTVTRTTDGSREGAYGMGFWLGHPDASAPDGIYYMSGFQGQYAVIVPSHELVVVRLGATNGTGTGTFKLVLDLISAMDGT